jgi:diguanylate cyclase (GGDEF)-like protein
MSVTASTLQARKVELLRAFLNQVPGRVSAILENWHHLVQADWNDQLLASLLERLRTLTDASEKFGVNQIKLSGKSLLSHLTDFNDPQHKPSRDQVVKMDGLVHAFQDAAMQACEQAKTVNAAAQGEAIPPSGSNQAKIFLLGIYEASYPGLISALHENQFQVQTLEDAEELFEILQTDPRGAGALISHIEWLEELYPADRQQGLWHQSGGLPGLPVAFISDSNDLQTRLAAMRTESKIYWTDPIDPLVVADRMRTLTAPESHSAYRVLIVEDDPAQADFAAAILKKAHFACRSVLDPLQVMDVLNEFRPDLILMDLYMPGASGSEMTAVIREQSEYVDTPIVFLSGEQDLDKQLKALSFGGEDFLAKPIAPKHLISTVTNRIRRAQQLTHCLGRFDRHEDESGLLSRGYLLERIDALLGSQSFDCRCPAVLYLDIDNAEEIIRLVGIGGMDVVLAEIGAHLSLSLQPKDLLSRFGDNSIGLFTCRDSVQDLEALSRRLCREVAERIIEVDDHTLGVTLSIGVLLIDEPHQDARSLMSRAKLASVTAHRAGGNQFYIQLPEEPREMTGKTANSITGIIKQAIEKGYFEIFFQPIVALKGSQSDRALYQTLIRLQEPEGKLLMAGEFIPTAEQIGLIDRIDHWTTRSALSIIDEQVKQGKRLHLFVSQSANLLENMERLSWLREKHHSGLIHEHSLTFEFRLSEVAKQLKSAKICFEMLHDMGIGTLLTGVDHSVESQRTLNHLKVSFIKLHPKLLQQPDQGLKGLMDLTRSLGIETIATQVEDPRSIALLWSSGTDYVQGFFVQRPENNLIYDFNESILT